MSVHSIDAAIIRAWLERCAQVMAENKTHLTELDSPIGDSDHGNNMDRGFKAVVAQLPEGDDIGALLKATAMALISKVGGAAGPLYGTFFLEASKPLMGRSEIDEDHLTAILDGGIEGVKKRGKSDAGMKTMLDALIPAATTCRDYIENEGTILSGLHAAAQAAETGMKDTIPMQAQRGRASYLGARSIGHQDPGATSGYLIVKALADVVAEASE